MDFLGFHHRYVRGNTPRSRHLAFLVAGPHVRPWDTPASGSGRSRTAQGSKSQSKSSFGTSTGSCAAGRATSGYGNSAQFFNKIMLHAYRRLAGLIAKRHKQRKRYGFWVLAHTPDRFGLITLNGTITAPRLNRPWRQGS